MDPRGKQPEGQAATPFFGEVSMQNPDLEEEEKINPSQFQQIEQLLEDANQDDEDFPIVKTVTQVSIGSNHATKSLNSQDFSTEGGAFRFFEG
jgi:hypothetical protein